MHCLFSKKTLIIPATLFTVCSLWAQPIFRDASENEGINFEHVLLEGPRDLAFGTGAAWIDCDSDGDLDLYISQRNGANSLYRNNRIGLGTPNFTDIAEGSALDVAHDGGGVSIADYDNDGDQDIYLANSTQDVLLQNDGSCHFTDVTAVAFPDFPSFQSGRGATASWGDLNNDGWLDLYVSNHIGLYNNPSTNTQDFLFMNEGGNPTTFKDMSSRIIGDVDQDGVDDTKGTGFVAALTDIDNDGDLDIFATNECPFGPEDNKIWLNEGDFNFTEASDEIGPFIGGKPIPPSQEVKADCQTAMGMAVGDPNRDGRQDYFYSNWNTDTETAVFLYNNNQNLLDKTVEAGLKDYKVPLNDSYRITWGASFLDYDQDMLLDLAVAAGEYFADEESFFSLQPNMLYHNTGLNQNLPVYSLLSDEESGIGNYDKGRTLITGDYDLDGDPDIFLVNYGGKGFLYENQVENNNHWIIVELEGAGPPLSNSNGIGAKIRVTTQDGITQHHEVKSGSSLGGGDDLAASFGLAANQSVTIDVLWPSGVETNTGEISADRRVRIFEDEPSGLKIPDEKSVKLFPNPLKGQGYIDVELDEASSVKISIVTAWGEIVNQLVDLPVLPSGSYRYQYDGSLLEAGCYLIRTELDNTAFTQKLLKY